jgi:hypothetical protein
VIELSLQKDSICVYELKPVPAGQQHQNPDEAPKACVDTTLVTEIRVGSTYMVLRLPSGMRFDARSLTFYVGNKKDERSCAYKVVSGNRQIISCMCVAHVAQSTRQRIMLMISPHSHARLHFVCSYA